METEEGRGGAFKGAKGPGLLGGGGGKGGGGARGLVPAAKGVGRGAGDLIAQLEFMQRQIRPKNEGERGRKPAAVEPKSGCGSSGDANARRALEVLRAEVESFRKDMAGPEASLRVAERIVEVPVPVSADPDRLADLEELLEAQHNFLRYHLLGFNITAKGAGASRSQRREDVVGGLFPSKEPGLENVGAKGRKQKSLDQRISTLAEAQVAELVDMHKAVGSMKHRLSRLLE